MPNMISLRTFRLATTTGHVIQFKAKEPKFVHPDAVSEAMKAGCVPVEEADLPSILKDDLSRATVDFTGDVRRSIIHLLVSRIAKENVAKNFDAGGQPKAEVLSSILGFPVGAAERTQVWRAYQTANSTGDEVPLHADASKALDVIDAASKADLLLLAKDFGVPLEEVEGLSARDLRKTLLGRFNGLTIAA